MVGEEGTGHPNLVFVHYCSASGLCNGAMSRLFTAALHLGDRLLHSVAIKADFIILCHALVSARANVTGLAYCLQ